MKGIAFRIQVSGFRIQDSGFKIQVGIQIEERVFASSILNPVSCF